MKLIEQIGERILFFDGAMGTSLQKYGDTPPEILNITNPEAIISIHESYIKAGSDIITTNTFGAYCHKFDNIEQIISKALINAKTAVLRSGRQVYTAFDMGPVGSLIKPLGDLEFSTCYNIFKESAILGEKYGADIVIIETIADIYEAKAAILAVKENTSLPLFCTMTYDKNGKCLTGGDILTMVSLLEGLGVDAIGINCGFGPDQTEPLLRQLIKYASTPVIVQPNAGLPVSVGGKAVFDLPPQKFAAAMKRMGQAGALILGGCCGTTPDYIAETVKECRSITPQKPTEKGVTLISSGNKALIAGNAPLIIGERINPTGKSRLKNALLKGDMNLVAQEALDQEEAGAHILDVNMGLPQINEIEYMVKAITTIQALCSLPLQIDSSSPEVIEAALRVYNGKALINSVSGKRESMEKIFPLVKKYGGVVIGLTIDESGIPETDIQRLEIAEKIVNKAKAFGIKEKDIVIDPLTMTVSAQQDQCLQTLSAMKLIKEKLNVKTVLGVSNISFGLPARKNVNTAFFVMALSAGLDLCIINPLEETMTGAFRAFNALTGSDENCKQYIDYYGGKPIDASSPLPRKENLGLYASIVKGLREPAYNDAKELLSNLPPFDVINNHIVKALDYVGDNFEKGTMFLPQLIMSAESAKRAFDAIKEKMAADGTKTSLKGKILLATVQGDSHDIGKNIVRALLENYGYEIIDLGKDVAAEKICRYALDNDIKLVGLSALMTTTVVSMEKTIKQLREIKPDCRVMVGGAVLNESYAKMIDADYYAKDALSAIPIAREVLGH